MNGLRLFAALCIIMESMVFGLATRDVLVAGLAVLIIVPSFFRQITIAVRGQIALFATLAVGVSLITLAAPYDRPGPFDIWGDAIMPIVGLFRYTAFAHAVGQFALLFQACQLILKPVFAEHVPRRVRMFWGLDSLFPFYGVPVLICAGDLIAASSLQIVFLVGSGLCVASASLYFTYLRADGRINRTSWLWIGFTLVVSAIIATTLSGVVFNYGHRADRLLGAFLSRVPPQIVGFGGQSSLGTIADMQLTGDAVALRVYSDDAPGYLHGRAYNTLSGSSWFARGNAREVLHAQLEEGSAYTYEIVPGVKEESGRELEVWPASNLPSIIFHGDNTIAVECRSDSLTVDEVDNINVDEPEPYRLRTSVKQEFHKPSSEELERCLAVPDQFEPGVAALSQRLLGDTSSAMEAGVRLSQYFSGEYSYKIGITIPAGRDPLSFFLLEKPPAHCEYFAAGSTMLLRLAGYPARYVTGFVAAEESSVGDYWIARSRHAHAWCEVYDPVQGWMLVESTPAEGVPEVAPVSSYQQWREYISHYWHQLRAAIAAFDIKALARVLASKFSVVLIVVFAVLLCILRWPAIRRMGWGRRSSRNAADEGAVEPIVVELRGLLARVDARIAAMGYTRESSESFSTYARRLREEGHDPYAAWYVDYERLRFSGEADEEGVADLEASIPEPSSGF